MDTKEILIKLNRVVMSIKVHPDNEQNSEFADNISDLEEIEELITAQSKPETIETVNPTAYRFNEKLISFEDMKGQTVSDSDTVIPLYEKQLIEKVKSVSDEDNASFESGYKKGYNRALYEKQYIAEESAMKVFEWMKSDNCWITDKEGNRLSNAVIDGENLAKYFKSNPIKETRIGIIKH